MNSFSEDDSAESGRQGSRENAPETCSEVVRDVFQRILAGMGFVGAHTRNAATSAYSAVARMTYPVKEACVHGYDSVVNYLSPATEHEGGAPVSGNIVDFTRVEDQSMSSSR